MGTVKKEKKTYWVVLLGSQDIWGNTWRRILPHLYRTKRTAREAGHRKAGKGSVVSYDVFEVST
jgi:hypothetical protein